MDSNSKQPERRERLAIIPESVLSAGRDEKGRTLPGAWADLPGMAKAVYVPLVMHASRGKGRCWPSLAELAKLSGIHRGNVSKAIGQLIEAGLVKRIQPGGGNMSTNYEVVAPAQHLPSEGSRASATPVVAPAQQGSRGSATDQSRQRNQTYQRTDQGTDQTNSSSKAAGSAGAAGDGVPSDVKQISAILQGRGIWRRETPRLARVAVENGLSPLDVALLADDAEITHDSGNPDSNWRGLLIRKIENGDRPEVTPLRVQFVLAGGDLSHLGGVSLAGGKFRHDGTSVYLGDRAIWSLRGGAVAPGQENRR